MPLERFYKLGPERQAHILAVARAELCQHGFAAASYNTIIKQAGVSKGAMYYYFSDKADLATTVIEHALAPLFVAIGPLGPFTDAPSFWAELARLTERGTFALLADPSLAELARLIYEEGPAAAVLQHFVHRSQAWLIDVLARGQAVGAVRTDLPLDLLATGLTGMLVHIDRWFTENLSTLSLDEFARLSTATLELAQQVARPPQS